MKRLGLTAAAVLLSSATLHAATYTVDTTTDEAGAGFQVCSAAPNDCSLRGAVIKANASAGTDEILLPASATPYAVTIPKGGEGDNAGALVETTGDIDITEALKITGDGADATAIAASGTNDRVFMGNIGGAGSIEITGVKISGGNAGFRGGAIWSFNGALALNDCWITGNSAAADGGGVAADNAAGPSLIILNTTISDNTAAQRGGGLFYETGDAIVLNSTLSNNTATGDGTANTGGGAIDIVTGSMDVVHSTLIGNKVTTGGSQGGAVRNAAGGAGDVFRFKNSLLLNNTVAGAAQNCANSGNAPSSLGHNISSDASCTATFLASGTDQNSVTGTIVSDTLADNGGPTPTHLPPSDSPAIDFVPAADCSNSSNAPLTEDQRGSGRPEDGDADGTADCDAGAVEIEAAPGGTTGGTTAGSTGGGTAGTGGSTAGGDSGGGCSLIR